MVAAAEGVAEALRLRLGAVVAELGGSGSVEAAAEAAALQRDGGGSGGDSLAEARAARLGKGPGQEEEKQLGLLVQFGGAVMRWWDSFGDLGEICLVFGAAHK